MVHPRFSVRTSDKGVYVSLWSAGKLALFATRVSVCAVECGFVVVQLLEYSQRTVKAHGYMSAVKVQQS